VGCDWLQYDYKTGVDAFRPAELVHHVAIRTLLPVPDGPVRHPVPVGGTPLLSAAALRQTFEYAAPVD
jgi:threonine synthase